MYDPFVDDGPEAAYGLNRNIGPTVLAWRWLLPVTLAVAITMLGDARRMAVPALPPAATGAGGSIVRLDPVGQIGGASNAVAVAGDLALVGIGPRLVAMDVSDPANVVELGASDPMDGVVIDIAVASEHAFVTDGFGLKVLDVRDPLRPRLVAETLADQTTDKVAIAGIAGCHLATLLALQPMNLILPHDYLRFGNVHLLMAFGIRIGADQRLAAARATLGYARNELVHLIHRHKRARVSLMTLLTATWPPVLPALRRSVDFGAVARRRLGGVTGVLLQPLLQLPDSLTQLYDERLQLDVLSSQLGILGRHAHARKVAHTSGSGKSIVGGLNAYI